MIAGHRYAVVVWNSRRRLAATAAVAVILVIGLVTSLWTTWETSNGALVLTWCAVWSLGAGITGWYARSWLWSVLCPAAMLILVLLWVAVFGHTSWNSAFLTVLTAMFAVSATIGAVLGTWVGKRRRSPG